MTGIFPPKPDHLQRIFGVRKPIIGVIHLPPIPGSPRYAGQPMTQIVEFALRDAHSYHSGGVDGLIVENAWDLPFAKPDQIGPETVASMTAVALEIRREVPLPQGINVLANAAVASLAVAKASGAAFVRINQWVNAYVANEGLVEGASARAARYRAWLRADDEIAFFTDVHVKHGSHSIVADRSLADQAQDAVFFDADVLIATGRRTGDATPIDEINGIKGATQLPVIVGSGLTDDNADEILRQADGAIVASWLKEGGEWWRPVSRERVERLMQVARRVRISAP